MIHEFAFQFGWCNLKALVFDEFFDAICDIEVVLGILISHVTSFEVAVGG
jgi:hypothetical protein